MTKCSKCGEDVFYVSPEDGRCSNCIEKVHPSHTYTSDPNVRVRFGRCLKCRLWNDHFMNKFPCGFATKLEKEAHDALTAKHPLSYWLDQWRQEIAAINHDRTSNLYDRGYQAALERVIRELETRLQE